ncbi:MAG: RIP metalloprotease RseP [Myxococcales bacterium]|nr:RIP metalloprotease RseP [Myxococcales bacterium]
MTLLATVILLGVLITVHELGHFLVAKAAGVKCEVFSIGFGRPLVKKQIGETEYRIAVFPVGGYVRMLGMELDGPVDGPDKGRDLLSKSPLTRILIFAAGPAMNLILPFFLIVPFVALSDQADQVVANTVGAVDEGLPAWAAGLRAGDRVTAVDGEPVGTFWEIARAIHEYDGDGPLTLTVARPGADAPVELSVQPKLVERTNRRVKFSRESWHIGFQPAFLAADVAIADPAGPLAAAGVRTFDRVLKVGDTAITRLVQAEQVLGALPAGQTVTLTLERDRVLDPAYPFLTERATVTVPYTAPAAGTPLGVEHAWRCISSVAPDTPAARVLQVGDCILEVDGHRHSLGAFVQNRLTNAPDQPKRLKIRRGGRTLEVTVEPLKVVHSDPMAGEIEQWQLGLVLMVRPDTVVDPDLVTNDQRLAHAWYRAKEQVGYELLVTLNMVGGLFTGAVSPTQLSGPITIAAVAGQYAKAGLDHFLHLMIMLSLSIALLNLLPVPGLDGGQMMVATVELIARRPLSPKLRQGLQMVGFAMILLLILFVTGNDLLRQWRMHAG